MEAGLSVLWVLRCFPLFIPSGCSLFAILALHLAYMRAGYVYPAIVMCVLWVVLVTKMADILPT